MSREKGVEFGDFREFQVVVDKLHELYPTFSPRKWGEENMTDEIAANNFVNILKNKNIL